MTYATLRYRSGGSLDKTTTTEDHASYGARSGTREARLGADSRRLRVVTMPAYGDILIDIDLGIGRQFGYRHPRRADITEDSETLTPVRNAADCHPGRPNEAHGLCKACYHRARHCGRR